MSDDVSTGAASSPADEAGHLRFTPTMVGGGSVLTPSPARHEPHEVDARVTNRVPSLDHYARLVRRLLGVPTSTVTIVEGPRQIFPGASVLQEPCLSGRQALLSHSYCQYVVEDARPLIVSDARQDPRWADSPAVQGLDAIAYLGWPLIDSGGRTVGSLCAMDTEPREWTDEDVHVLEDLASACSAELQHAGRVADEGESLARAIFASVDVAMAFYDPDGRLLLCNDAAERAAKAAGHRLDRPPFAGPQVRHADNITPVSPTEQFVPRALRGELNKPAMVWLGPPGDALAIVASSRRVLRGDGTLWGTLIAGNDVTDLARALEDLERATLAAEKANEAKAFFLANIGHELRTPLTGLLAARELLEDTDPAPQQSRLLETMERSGTRLRALIESLLEFAGLEAGEVVLRMAAFDLRTAVADVMAAADHSAKTGGLTLRSVVAPELPALVTGDSQRLQQVLRNLVDNAVKFTDEGAVTLTVSPHDPDSAPELLFTVTDSCRGIHPEHHAALFEPFTQVDPTITRRHGGSGLGLATCKQLVTMMGGTIWVSSVPGSGCTFTVRLPLRLP